MLRLLALFMALCAGGVVAQEAIPQPTYQIGALYVYQGVDLWKNEVKWANEQHIVRVDGDIVTWRYRGIPPSNASEGETRFNSAHQSIIRKGTEGAALAAQFPLTIGKTWEYEFKYPSQTMPGVTITNSLKARVMGWETITVPAGTFKVLRIEHRGYWTLSSGAQGEIENTFWYSPEIGRMVREKFVERRSSGAPNFQDERQLIKYQPTPDAVAATK